MTDDLDPKSRTVATFKGTREVRSYKLSPGRIALLKEGRQPPLDLPEYSGKNPVEVLESIRIGTVLVSSEWNHSRKFGQVSLSGNPESKAVLLGTVYNENDLVDLFDEICELFERMSLKGTLTLHTI